MKATLILLFLIIFSTQVDAQTLSSAELLNKSIEFHDPNNSWKSFNDSFKVTMQTPDKSVRESDITINLPKESFSLRFNKDSLNLSYNIVKDSCSFKINNKIETNPTILKTHNLNCERGLLLKDYYTYLYGLPMKLKDEGTIIKPQVVEKTINNKSYYVIEVHYKQDIGSDIWFFYFDKTTYAMEVYQFFKTDDSGQLKKDSGEYIILTAIETVNGIKMPKRRAWYYNKNDGYLGTDILSN
ncbi:MAG: hypothetical protein BM564_06530 [Bacteroidetes bacterium MedPE-SWsnd-G2]|nr:MAG: hypothetical protein BM564_06530 [Bacteroidetes bacterium MedPE-SWsnd-G2]